MFRSISSKLYVTVTILVILFASSYGILSFYLHDQNTLATQRLESLHIEKEIRLLNGLLYEMRFWEKKVLEGDHPEAFSKFGAAIEFVKKKLGTIDDRKLNQSVLSKLTYIKGSVYKYEEIFNKILQLKTSLNIQRTRLKTSYQSLISNILYNDVEAIYKPLFNLTQFFISYVLQQNDSVYYSLLMVSDYLEEKISQTDVTDKRMKEYLTTFKSRLKRDYELALEIKKANQQFDTVNANLIEKFDTLFLESADLFKSNFAQANTKRKRLNHSVLVLTIISIGVSLMIFIFFSRKLVAPIRSIAKVMREVRSGNVDSRFNLTGNKEDELIQFGYHFNTMLDTLQDNEAKQIESQRTIGEHRKLALVGQIAGKMAHDFNNILGIIMGNTELALMDCEDNRLKETLELIFIQTIRGKNLTKNLVAFAKDQEPKQEFFKLNEKIDLVVNLLKKDLENIEVIRENDPELPDLLADPGMIENTLVNIIQNSVHATSVIDNPKIIIRTFSSEENIWFEIEDNGCGIPDEHFQSIFEPSFTLKGRKDTNGSYAAGISGTGYGLSNVKKYINQHKGQINIFSRPGKGTALKVSLPIVRKELTPDEINELHSLTTKTEKKILLVEDEQSISDVQYRILSQEPCRHLVDVAPNGKVALELFEKNTYDLVSLDYILPGEVSGVEIYRRIRQTDKNIPVLFISGNIEFLESLEEMYKNDRHLQHLSKPCQNKDYVQSINQLLAGIHSC